MIKKPRSRTRKYRANAKINLYLKVGRPTSSGYHNIETIFQSINLPDVLKITYLPNSSGFKLKVQNSAVKIEKNNTVEKAYNYLLSRYPEIAAGGFKVVLKKNIPVGAGLGGGSSDAAAFLTGAVALTGIRPSWSMSAIAREIGADVPFCLNGGTSIACGLGDKMRKVKPLSKRKIILFFPKKNISTTWAYGTLDKYRETNRILKSPVSVQRTISQLRKGNLRLPFVNDFELPVFKKYSQFSLISEFIADNGFGGMTGSGSTFFLIPSKKFQKKNFPVKGVHIVETSFASSSITHINS